MAETLSEYLQSRGGLGLLVVLKTGAQRFTDLKNHLHISESTLTNRLGEARSLGLITPEINEKETSVDGQYRISERGQYVIAKAERLDVLHAYRTMLDMHKVVEEGKDELSEWVEDETVKKELAQRSDEDPYVDPFGYEVTSRGDTD